MPYRVYLIKNSENRTYLGLSDDINRRLNDHNTGVSTWTRYRGPWVLHWVSYPQRTLAEARKLESLLKRQKGGSGLLPLLKLNGDFSETGS